MTRYGVLPDRTYVSGVSVGATVTRRLMETNADEFDGGLAWQPPYVNVDNDFNGLIGTFPVGLRHVPGYVASGYDPASPDGVALNEVWPPDIFQNPALHTGSYLGTHYDGPWTGLFCGNVKILDPDYAGALADYDYPTRVAGVPALRDRIAAISTTGQLQGKLISIHGTMDATAPIFGDRFYKDDVEAASGGCSHRYYEVQNGTHRDRWRDAPTNYSEVEYMLPHFVRAFEAMVNWVESGAQPPPNQCVPRGDQIVDDPSIDNRPEQCAERLVPSP